MDQLKKFWNGLTRTSKAHVSAIVSFVAGVVLMNEHHDITPNLIQSGVTWVFVYMIPNWES